MYQNDRGSYRTKESLFTQFYHSCLGKFILAVVTLCILAFVAHITRPSERKMLEKMTDNVRQCIEKPDSIRTDWIDDAVANVGYIFTEAGPNVDKESWENFNKYNRMVYYDRWLYSSIRIFNNFNPEGIRSGVGLFGVVIPMVNFNDLLLRVGPVYKEYKEPLGGFTGDDEYFGSTPDLTFKEDQY
jgi:hypothetical protein